MASKNTDVKTDRTKEEIEATVKVLLSEETKNQAEAESATAEAKRHKAETRQREAEAKKAEIELARLLRAEKSELAKDQYHHIYIFDKPVGSQSVELAITKLAEWSRTDPGCPIEIIWNSPGGSIVDGMALYDYIGRIRKAGHAVTCSTMGTAASMAGILLQSGEVRKMGPQAWLLIHQASFGAMGSFGDVEDTVDWVKMIQGRIVNIFAERAAATTNEPVAKVRKFIEKNWSRKDWWISADDALKYGFIDEIG